MRLIKWRRGIRWDPESIVVSGPSNTTMASLVVLLLERRLWRGALFLAPGRLGFVQPSRARHYSATRRSSGADRNIGGDAGRGL